MGKTLKVDVHTIREDQHGGEFNTTERMRFARISVELNLNKILIPRVKIRNRTYRIEYEGLNLICFACEKYGHHKESSQTKEIFESNNNDGGGKVNSPASRHAKDTNQSKKFQNTQDNLFGN